MKSIKLGFTGTREGMSSAQAVALCEVLVSLRLCNLTIVEAHHGMCIGADAQFDGAVRPLNVQMHLHPCDIKRMQARNLVQSGDIVYPEKPPLERNQDILVCDTIIGVPKEMKEIQRSGTWSTIRHAEKQKKDLIVILPDGSVSVGDIPL